MSQRRLKVVTLVDDLIAQGGAERVAMRLAERLDRDRFESILCAHRLDKTVKRDPTYVDPAEVEASGTRVIGLARRGRLDLASWRPLVRVLRDERVDVLHSHMFGSNVWGSLIGTLARVPVVISHEHTWSFEGEPLRRFADRNVIARLSDCFIAVSREDRRRMIEIERIAPEKIRIVQNGIDETRAPTGKDVRGELGIPAGAPVVGTVGVMRPQKAFHVLIRAVARAVKRFPELRLLIVGDGPERERLEALVDELGVRDSVVFAGFRPDIPDVLAAFDIAALSSDFEGSPLAVIEFMDAGKPVAATAVGGVPDLIEDGVHGLLAPAGDDAALAAAIEKLVGDPALRERMGAAARERRLAELGFDTTVHAVEALYEELFARTKRARTEGFRPAPPRTGLDVPAVGR